MEVVLPGLLTTDEAALGKFVRDLLQNQVADVLDVALGFLKESVLDISGDFAVVDLEKATVLFFLLLVELHEAFRVFRELVKGSLT